MTLMLLSGTLTFDYANSSGDFLKLELNSYSWTKVANIIFIDQPAGTGYSDENTSEAFNCSDTLSVTLTYDFLRKGYIQFKAMLKPIDISTSMVERNMLIVWDLFQIRSISPLKQIAMGTTLTLIQITYYV
ncbi:hypothetical protein RDI58_024625 [Solanum bulbocastanum]|uniref:Uncharacterized protein n=1 Tax=Solanum bulbocastanum TaxID=147425 RepID=A0AAN8T293_SOLBU